MSSKVSKAGFDYIDGVLFANSSTGNPHARVSALELAGYAANGSDREMPWHWFEAQLKHYGLPTSKAKAVARGRLHDAARSGRLTVPASIQKLEADLARESRDMHERKCARAAPRADVSAVEFTVSVSLSEAGGKRKVDVVAASGNAPHKAMKATVEDVTDVEYASTHTPRAKQTARRTGAQRVLPETRHASARQEPAPAYPRQAPPQARSNESRRSPPPTRTYEPPPPYTEYAGQENTGQRRPALGLLNGDYTVSYISGDWGYDEIDLMLTLTLDGNVLWGKFNFGVIQGILRIEERPRSSSQPPKTFAWRGKDDRDKVHSGDSNMGEMSFLGDGFLQGDFDWQGLSFSCKRFHGQGTKSPVDARAMRSEWESYHSVQHLPPLGLLNGDYTLTSSVSDEYDFEDEDFFLTFTLDGGELWGKFSLGIVEGIMHFDQRPMMSSRQSLSFIWRGREHEGESHYGDDNYGHVTFLGDGCVEGQLGWMSLKFCAWREQGQGTRSSVDAHAMRNEWDSYTEEQYEYERRARWR